MAIKLGIPIRITVTANYSSKAALSNAFDEFVNGGIAREKAFSDDSAALASIEQTLAFRLDGVEFLADLAAVLDHGRECRRRRELRITLRQHD